MWLEPVTAEPISSRARTENYRLCSPMKRALPPCDIASPRVPHRAMTIRGTQAAPSRREAPNFVAKVRSIIRSMDIALRYQLIIDQR